VQKQIEGGVREPGTEGSGLVIALLPPGNVARDLALFRRGLFSRLGEASALAFPEMVPLAFASPGGRLATRELEGCWKGIGGSFSSAAPVVSGGLLYLALGGPLEELCSRAAQALRAGGLAPLTAPPLETGVGVFLCRPADPSMALSVAEGMPPPRAAFGDCSLALLALRIGPERDRIPGAFVSLRWRELARARRRGRSPWPPQVMA